MTFGKIRPVCFYIFLLFESDVKEDFDYCRFGCFDNSMLLNNSGQAQNGMISESDDAELTGLIAGLDGKRGRLL